MATFLDESGCVGRAEKETAGAVRCSRTSIGACPGASGAVWVMAVYPAGATSARGEAKSRLERAIGRCFQVQQVKFKTRCCFCVVKFRARWTLGSRALLVFR